MRYPDICLAAIEVAGLIYGAAEAVKWPRQIVGGLHIGGERVGRVIIAYSEDHDFIDEESALLGDIVRRVGGYIERVQLLEEATRRAQREHTLRQITARVRGSTHPDTIVRAAVRELGTALGRPTFVRLGSAEQLRVANPEGGE
jgi:GAF domain-containing protein